MKNTPARIPISAWISPEDDQAVDDVLGCLHRANRHLVAIAAIRAGLRLLQDHPELLIELIQDQRAARQSGSDQTPSFERPKARRG